MKNKFHRLLIGHILANGDNLRLSVRDRKVLQALADGGNYSEAGKLLERSSGRIKQIADRIPAKISWAIDRLAKRPEKPLPPPPSDRHPIRWSEVDPKLSRLIRDMNPEPRYYEDLAYLFQSFKVQRQIGDVRLSMIAKLISENCDLDYHIL